MLISSPNTLVNISRTGPRSTRDTYYLSVAMVLQEELRRMEFPGGLPPIELMQKSRPSKHDVRIKTVLFTLFLSVLSQFNKPSLALVQRSLTVRDSGRQATYRQALSSEETNQPLRSTTPVLGVAIKKSREINLPCYWSAHDPHVTAMADDTSEGHGTQPLLDRGHPMPRRASAQHSITLKHHRLAREASKRAAPTVGAADPQQHNVSSPRRNSSGESQETDPSSKKWFDRSNANPAGTFDASAMDLDPPFFQKETESSYERDGAFPYRHGESLQVPSMHHQAVTRSSSADEFRGVIDDLTIENKRLREELRRLKGLDPPLLKKEKLFEIKVHGLPRRKKRELEATLRDFAASLEGSSDSPSQRDRSGRLKKDTVYSSGESRSKHASSSSSHSRPVDSAYASMSTGPSSHGPQSVGRSLGRPSASRAKSSEQKFENFLSDIPDGLLPRPTIMTDKERKKLVVRRLEQLFTGKISGRNMHRNQSMSALDAPAPPTTLADQGTMGPPRNPEASREARIEPLEPSQRKPRSRDNESTSNSNGDQTESRGNGNGSGDGNGSGNGSGGRNGNSNTPHPTLSVPEQRPTRPRDLDPDRLQIPSENLDYIRHLGQVPPEFLVDKQVNHLDVAPDAHGWVYLNLLCNLAQLHIFNVTPGFIRAAVCEKSKKFQLSPDGRKIRWRGGVDGTKFSSDSSGDNNSRSPSTDETDGSHGDGQRKRQKMAQLGALATTSKESKFGLQTTSNSDPFHYKPLFVHRNSTADTSVEDTGSLPSDGAVDQINSDSGSGSKRRRGGAIIYYSGAPFCTDLSGDPGEVSPTTYMTSTGREIESPESTPRLSIQRTLSGSSLAYRPLSEARLEIPNIATTAMDVDEAPGLISGDEESPADEDVEFPWCDNPEKVQFNPVEPPLEACGLGGVRPEDHFAVVVATRRPINLAFDKAVVSRSKSEDIAEAIAGRLSSLRTSSPLPPRHIAGEFWPVHVEYLKSSLHKFEPVPLPPPATFIPPFSTDSESLGDEELDYEEFESEELELEEGRLVSVGLISQLANPYLSDNSFDEFGKGRLVSSEESSDDIVGVPSLSRAVDANMSDGDDDLDLQPHSSSPGRIISASVKKRVDTGSSVATAGGAESGYSSSMEDDAS
ncbi:putative frequency clock protein [Cladorrhinum sp. PSN259]|nr:putative frequency clock protein [Cladorrhinum sp. PSN259]